MSAYLWLFLRSAYSIPTSVRVLLLFLTAHNTDTWGYWANESSSSNWTDSACTHFTQQRAKHITTVKIKSLAQHGWMELWLLIASFIQGFGYVVKEKSHSQHRSAGCFSRCTDTVKRRIYDKNSVQLASTGFWNFPFPSFTTKYSHPNTCIPKIDLFISKDSLIDRIRALKKSLISPLARASENNKYMSKFRFEN